MGKLFSLKYSLEAIATLIAAVAFVQVLYQFVIGKHFIIPTAILFICVLFGNLARYGLRDAAWAKHMLFWFGFIFSSYLFFAIFFAKTFRVWMGAAFEPVFIVLFLVVAFLTFQYKCRNSLAL